MCKKTKVKLAALIIILIPLVYFLYTKDAYTSIKNIFASPQVFKEFIKGQGKLAPIIFFLIQIAQVIISPIPGNITALVGGTLFGGMEACLLSGIGIIIGSAIAFYLARFFGRPLVIKLIGGSIFNKYSKVFCGKCTVSLFILFLLPFFPDDALCFLAGLSKIPVKLFLIFAIIGRSPSIVFASIAGAGIVKLSAGAWGVIATISLIAITLSIRYSKNIEEWLYSRVDFEKDF